ncbi:MAG: hypothetical protein AAGK05_18850, partial [Pseudomonadota bacterium]
MIFAAKVFNFHRDFHKIFKFLFFSIFYFIFTFFQNFAQHVTKVFFCSRTHSQLAQFLREFRRSPYGAEVSALCLGSRQSLCVNEAVRSLGANSLMNERCLELKAKAGKKPKRQKQTVAAAGCPFRRPAGMAELTDELLTDVLDIEDMGKQVSPWLANQIALTLISFLSTIIQKSTNYCK